MQDFKKLDVWREAHRLALNIHSSCDRKRFSTYPGKRAQILKCADSISANIAEGSAKRGAEFARYLDMSLASTNELENHLIFARDAHLMSDRRFNLLADCVDHVRRMLINLIKKIRGDGPS